MTHGNHMLSCGV